MILAHINHAHAGAAEQVLPPAVGERYAPLSALETTTSNADKASSDDSMAMPSSEMQRNAVDEIAIEEIPATQVSPSTSLSRAGLSDRFPISLGEPLLGLIITGPFVLIFLRKRLRA